jgi:hypothetical protein
VTGGGGRTRGAAAEAAWGHGRGYGDEQRGEGENGDQDRPLPRSCAGGPPAGWPRLGQLSPAGEGEGGGDGDQPQLDEQSLAVAGLDQVPGTVEQDHRRGRSAEDDDREQPSGGPRVRLEQPDRRASLREALAHHVEQRAGPDCSGSEVDRDDDRAQHGSFGTDVAANALRRDDGEQREEGECAGAPRDREDRGQEPASQLDGVDDTGAGRGQGLGRQLAEPGENGVPAGVVSRQAERGRGDPQPTDSDRGSDGRRVRAGASREPLAGEPAEREREPGEQQPAQHRSDHQAGRLHRVGVAGLGHVEGDSAGRRAGGRGDSEGEVAGDDVPVLSDDLPGGGVEPRRELGCGGDGLGPARGQLPDRAGSDFSALGVAEDQSEPGRVHRLGEGQRHLRRGGVDGVAGRRVGGQDGGVRRGRSRGQEHGGHRAHQDSGEPSWPGPAAPRLL